jgi:C4-dicarboxylate-specific signal transduction histidine kinase
MDERKYNRLIKKISVLEDLIENKTRELYLEKELTSNIIDCSLSVIIALNENKTVHTINTYGLSIIGKTSDKILGRNINEIFSKNDLEKIYNSEEISISTIDGEEKIFVFTVSKLDAINGTIITGVEVTEVKKANEILKNQELSLMQESRLRSLGEMSSMMAHEIKNPLGIMDGQLRRLKKEYNKKESDGEKINKLMLQLENNIHRIDQIINSLKIASRNSFNDNLEPVGISNVLTVLDDLIVEKMKMQNIMFIIENNAREIMIKAKVSELEQVFLNILSNSIYAVKDQKDPWIKLVVDHDEKSILIRFFDSGAGLCKEAQEKLFEPFFTTKEIGEGTGIGMTIVKKIIDAHNGSISYDKKSKYTCFVVEIPRFYE